MAKHYDVVVLGASVGALAAAALLARRSWRVLVLGHGWRRPTYGYDDLVLARRPFTFLSASSPAWGRILVELAQSQTFRRRLSSLDPMLQVLAPDTRLDLPPDTQLFAREIDREFPAVRRVVDDLYAELARTNAAADAAFERDAVWPPGGFWERRETARVLATLPWLEGPGDFLAEFPREHPFRDVVTTPARFASDLADDAPAFAVARLHGAWTRGVSHLAGGEDELADFLLERVRAHGGDTRLADRAASLVHKGGKVRGVMIDGDENPVGVTFVVSDHPTDTVLELARDFSYARGEKSASVAAAEGRFVMSLVVRPEGVPRPLATESFLLPAKGAPIHLQKAPGAAPGTVLLVAETIVPAEAQGEKGGLGRAREEMLATIFDFLPFVETHALACDSPHDGRPLWDFRNATSQDPPVGKPSWGLRARPIERARLRATGGSMEAEPMTPRFRVTPPQLHGLAAEAIRTPLSNVFVTGKSVLPALGQEGELLAAWGVARVITRTDRRKEKMLREMWSKVELS
ncbi:MAG: phytoene dehydrogenase [Deltaproteobacteria bacterium]|nr:phytoene dehydrogenase [Deltaproteobacteria bacterium]